MHHAIKPLVHKGWARHELEKAAHILKTAESKKPMSLKALDQSFYHLSLVIGVLLQIVLALMFIILSIALHAVYLYPLAIVIGIAFGMLMSHLMESMKHLSRKQHVIAASLFSVFAFTSGISIVLFSNFLSDALNLGFAVHIPWLFGIVYMTAFVLPYLFFDFSFLEQ